MAYALVHEGGGVRRIDVNANTPNLRFDVYGQPIHGLLRGSSDWDVVEVEATADEAWITARLVFDQKRVDFSAFPFEHHIELKVTLRATSLTFSTAIVATGQDEVPDRVRLASLPVDPRGGAQRVGRLHPVHPALPAGRDQAADRHPRGRRADHRPHRRPLPRRPLRRRRERHHRLHPGQRAAHVDPLRHGLRLGHPLRPAAPRPHLHRADDRRQRPVLRPGPDGGRAAGHLSGRPSRSRWTGPADRPRGTGHGGGPMPIGAPSSTAQRSTCARSSAVRRQRGGAGAGALAELVACASRSRA